MLDCAAFLNADIIAAELSPGDPERVAIQAGRIMLSRLDELMEDKADFAFETTLSTKSYVSLIKTAREKGYKVTLLYIWLRSPETAMKRVTSRVAHGGHNIPADVIRRRYDRGLFNLHNLYTSVCDRWIVVDNGTVTPRLISEGGMGTDAIQPSEFAQKIIKGMRKAIRKLVEERAAKGGTLVIGENGVPKEVPAKDLLAQVADY
jgi:predicted ABC-type ATPase